MSAEALTALWLSVRVAVVATAANAVIGIPLAYLLARRRFAGRGLLDLLVTLPLVLPPTVTGYYLIVLLGRRGWLGAPLYALTGWSVAFTWWAAVVAATTAAYHVNAIVQPVAAYSGAPSQPRRPSSTIR